MGIKENFHKVGSWRAWYGSNVHLRRLLRIIEKASRQHVHAYIAQMPTQARAKIERSSLDLRIRCLSKGRDMQELFGEAGDLTAWLDGRTFDRLELSSPMACSEGHSIDVILDRTDGVVLRVDSRDAPWARSVYAELEGELELRCPALSKLRKAAWSYPLCFLFSSILTIIGVDIAAHWLTESGKYDHEQRGIILTFMSVFILLVTLLLPTVLRRFIPAIEVLPAGKDSKMSRMGHSLIASIATVLFGILIEILIRIYLGEENDSSSYRALGAVLSRSFF